MVDISENPVWGPVTRIEATTVALGGDEINSPNLQLKQLVDRTEWLRENSGGGGSVGITEVVTDSSLYGNGTPAFPLGVQPLAAGIIHQFAGNIAPNGYLLCNGANVGRATYPQLFTAIGTIYGSDSAETFKLPNLSSRVPVGVGGTYTIGATGGSATHTLTTNEMPSHGHTTADHGHGINDPSHFHSLNPYFKDSQTAGGVSGDELTRAGTVTEYPDTSPATTGITINNANVTVNANGGSQPHNNMQPYIVLNYIIKF